MGHPQVLLGGPRLSLCPPSRGLAAPCGGLVGLEASVGIITLGDLDADTVGPLVERAAVEVATAW